MQDRPFFDADSGQTGREQTPGENERSGPAWESEGDAGTLRALLATLYGSMFSPTRFFSNMRRRDGYLNPLIYAVILGSFAILVSIGWECLLIYFGGSFVDAGSSDQLAGLRPVSYGLTAVLSPVMVAVLVLIASGIFHLVLLVLGGATQGFQTSFRVVCYSQGTGVWNIIPFFGAAIGGIWNLVLLVIGLAESHQTSAWKAAAAVLIPVVAWSVLLVGLIVTMSGFGFL